MLMNLRRLSAMPCVLAVLAMVPVRAQERGDLSSLYRIKDEAFQNSKVMDDMFYLTDVNGPRVTNSTGYFGAADWVVKQLTEWGITAHQEKWPFGRGWNYTKFYGAMVEPQYAPLIGYPQAWTGSTNGLVRGEPMMLPNLTTEADLEKYKGQLKGKIILIGPARDLAMKMTPDGRRYTDAELVELAVAPDPGVGGRGPIFIGGPQAAAAE